MLTARRAAIPLEERGRLSRQLAEIDFGPALPLAPAVVSGFLPIGEEIDARPLMGTLAALGYLLALPVVAGRGLPLVFRRYRPGDALVAGQWGLREPGADAAEVAPDALLVPLLGFDRDGNRLGYGAGYYDRSIAGLRRQKAVVAIGIAFDQQRIDAVPHLDYDERLDWVATPSGLIDCRT
jgi:5-formyltetrahydrofolate cyclo-ligase